MGASMRSTTGDGDTISSPTKVSSIWFKSSVSQLMPELSQPLSPRSNLERPPLAQPRRVKKKALKKVLRRPLERMSKPENNEELNTLISKLYKPGDALKFKF